MIKICTRAACGISYPSDSLEALEGYCICGAPLQDYPCEWLATAPAGPSAASTSSSSPHRRVALVAPHDRPPAAAPSPAPGMLLLIAHDGRTLRRVPLDRDEIWIGRPSMRRGPVDIDCSCWPEYGISRRHCLVLRTDRAWHIQRGMDARAVWWNGRALAPGERALLAPGAEVVLGDGLGVQLVTS